MLGIFGADIWKLLALCGAMAFLVLGNVEKILQLAIRIFDTVINFVRSENLSWLRGHFRGVRTRMASERAIQRAKKSTISKIVEHIAQSIFLYIFFGLVSAFWIVSVCIITINEHHVPQWRVLVGLVVMTLLCTFPGQKLKKAADKERRAAQLLWKTYAIRSLKTYVALMTGPFALIALTWAVTALQRMGGN